MSKSRQLWIGLSLIIGILGLMYLVRLFWFRPDNINHFLQRVMIEYLEQDPELLSIRRPHLQSQLSDIDQRFNNPSLQNQRAVYQNLQANLEILETYPYQSLDPEDKITYDILHQWIKDRLADSIPQLGVFPFNPVDGPQIFLHDFLVNHHPIRTMEEGNYFKKRLRRIGQRFDQDMDLLQEQLSRGIYPSAWEVNQAIRQIEQFLESPNEDNLLFRSTGWKAAHADPTQISQYKGMDLLENTLITLRKHVYPAYQKLAIQLDSIRDQARPHSSLSSLDSNLYLQRISHYGKDTIRPNSLLNQATEEMAHAQVQIQHLLDSMQVPGTILGERLQWLAQQEGNRFAKGDSNWQEITQSFRKESQHMRGLTYGLFGWLPTEVPEIRTYRSLDPYLSPGQFWLRASMDGAWPSRIWLNPPLLQELASWRLKAQNWAAVYPGWFLLEQGFLQNQNLSDARQLMRFPNVEEAWSHYARYMVNRDLLLLNDQVLLKIAHLQEDLILAGLVVADIKLHWQQMNQQQLYLWLQDELGMSSNEAQNHLARIICFPGMTIRPFWAFHTLLELRSHARELSGDQLILRDFHKALFQLGPAPFSVYNKWIHSQHP